MMRIAQVVSLAENVPPRRKSGLEFVVSWLTDGLVSRGHKVTLFAPAASRTKARLVSLLANGLSGRGSPAAWAPTFFSTWNTLLAGQRAEEFDLIHCHNGNAHFLAPFVSQPLVETIHHPYDDTFQEKYLSEEAARRRLAPLLAHFKKIHYVTVSRRQLAFYRSGEPYYFKKYTVIYNGIPVEKFSFGGRPGDYLLYLGYLNAEKGADLAVEVARRAGLRLKLAGDYFGTETFFQEKIKPYLGKEIEYLGPVGFAEKIELYRNAKAFLAPLRWEEPFGLTLVEAQACGTPVIALNRGAALELVKHGETGFVVGNVEEMVEVLHRIAEIDRRKCRAWVEVNFSVERMIDDYERFYQKILS